MKAIKRPRRNGELRPKDLLFCEAIAAGMNGTQAYREHIADNRQVKRTTAQVEAYKLLRNPKIALCITKLRERDKRAIEERLGFTKEQAMADLVGAWQTPIGEIDEWHPYCQEKTVTESENGTITKLKSVSKMEALEKLAKMAGWYPSNGNGGAVQPITINIGAAFSGVSPATPQASITLEGESQVMRLGNG